MGANSPENTQFLNNIITAEGHADFDFGTMRRTMFDSNAFWGAFTDRPADVHAVTTNPRLVFHPGGVVSPSGARLMPNSPCIGAGTPIPANGGRDFWGKSVPATGRPNIGACQQ